MPYMEEISDSLNGCISVKVTDSLILAAISSGEAFAVAVTELSVVWLPEEVAPPEQPINVAESASAAKMIGTDFLNFIIHQHSF